MPRPIPHVCAILTLTAFLACGGDDPGSPEEPDPPEGADPAPPDVSDRVLLEGTYDVTFTACEACSPGSMPDYLLVLSRDVRGEVIISGAALSGAALRLVEMRTGGSEPDDILGLFARPIISLRWSEADEAFRGAVNYGAAAVFMPIFRRVGERIECDFEVFHSKHDVGATTCTISD